MTAPSIHWFRNDLRLFDNPALAAATAGGPVIPVFILDDDAAGDWKTGAMSRRWLHRSLESLNAELRKLGGKLVLRKGDSWPELWRIMQQTGAQAVYWNDRYEPWAVKQDAQVEREIAREGKRLERFNGALLFDHAGIATPSGDPYKVFTPFSRHCLQNDIRPIIGKPEKIEMPEDMPDSVPLTELGLDGELREDWTPGEQAAQYRLGWFIENAVHEYRDKRDYPESPSHASKLSAHIAHGEISPVYIWHTVSRFCLVNNTQDDVENANAYLVQLLWREFHYYLLQHFPQMPDAPLNRSYENFQWGGAEQTLQCWREGRTGYPIVDAGMRQLRRTGWLPNRVRMIAASFLVKDLLQHWKHGQDWFWRNLVDADLANNAASWQWVSGCGADAAPFFRIFNPMMQSRKFDPHGRYIKAQLPELAELSERYIHAPWEAPEEALERANVTLGETYPKPVVYHAIARKHALELFEAVKTGTLS